MNILVGARASPLSMAQVKEVLRELQAFHPEVAFTPVYTETAGDMDQKTSLRSLEKTDFFTREVDQLLLHKKCRIAIHSAKDLPEPLTQGIALIALSKGIDPSDALVLREGERLQQNQRIATSSYRREAMVSALCADLTFVDIRGTIEKRLERLTNNEVDGVVIAEAALIRLGLTHLNRIRLPGLTAPFQGRLAVTARVGDFEMKELFSVIHDPVPWPAA